MVDPEPRLYLARLRWAGTIIKELGLLTGADILEKYSTARRFLRLVNSLRSEEEKGIAYLDDVLAQLIEALNINLMKFVKRFHAAMRNSTATRELTTDLRGTGKSIPKLSSIAA